MFVKTSFGLRRPIQLLQVCRHGAVYGHFQKIFIQSSTHQEPRFDDGRASVKGFFPVAPFGPDLKSMLFSNFSDLMRSWTSDHPGCKVWFKKSKLEMFVCASEEELQGLIASLQTHLSTLDKNMKKVEVDLTVFSALNTDRRILLDLLRLKTRTKFFISSNFCHHLYIYGDQEGRDEAIRVIRNIEKMTLAPPFSRTLRLDSQSFVPLSGDSYVLDHLALSTNTVAFAVPSQKAVVIRGVKEDVEMMETKIHQFLAFPRESLKVAKEDINSIIGYRGLHIRSLSIEFDVGISYNIGTSTVNLCGPPDPLSCVKSRIQSIVDSLASCTVEIPVQYFTPLTSTPEWNHLRQQFPTVIVQQVDTSRKSEHQLRGPSSDMEYVKAAILKQLQNMQHTYIIEKLQRISFNREKIDEFLKFIKKLSDQTNTFIYLVGKDLLVTGLPQNVSSSLPVIKGALETFVESTPCSPE